MLIVDYDKFSIFFSQLIFESFFTENRTHSKKGVNWCHKNHTDFLSKNDQFLNKSVSCWNNTNPISVSLVTHQISGIKT